VKNYKFSEKVANIKKALSIADNPEPGMSIAIRFIAKVGVVPN
jgi:hypothetical protein